MGQHMFSSIYSHVQQHIFPCLAACIPMFNSIYSHVQQHILLCLAAYIPMFSSMYSHVQQHIFPCLAVYIPMFSSIYSHVQQHIFTCLAAYIPTFSWQVVPEQAESYRSYTQFLTLLNDKKNRKIGFQIYIVFSQQYSA